jgi:murein DD-endopeptidase MepM/ murein hydrolase activator NlpD
LALLFMVACILVAAPQSRAQSPCQQFVNKIKELKSERVGLQNDMKNAAAQQKGSIAAQIKQLDAQISAEAKKLDNCYRTSDKLATCLESPDVYYTPPFGSDAGWTVTNGNWDDPVNGHNKGNPNGLQAYAFDFVRDENHDGVGEGGQKVLAARGGTVYAFVESETGNSWGGGNPPGYKGVGNFLVIKHTDGTFGVYWHLSKDGVLVNLGDTVKRGDLVGLSGNTGNSSTAHIHFDVRTGWSLGYPADKKEYPSIKIHLMDYNHTCWRPKAGASVLSVFQ